MAVFAAVAALGGEVWAQGPVDDGGVLADASELTSREIAQVQFRGNRKVEDDAIRAVLLTKAGGRLDLAKVREDIRAMWEMGFFSDVVVEAEPDPGGGVIIIFSVAEKPSVRKILVSGNDELELDKINEVIDLKRDAILNVTKVKQNRDKVRELYVERDFTWHPSTTRFGRSTRPRSMFG